ncbi:nardilysin-like [Antedon mediterranea]|uniref:nardilysin-like n=1 Tax=Antedon mediterranea TaxID=105859 RepID=UPI003AF40B2E
MASQLLQSPNDFKKYRIIQLPNNLVAIVISDLSSDTTSRNTTTEQKRDTCCSSDEEVEEGAADGAITDEEDGGSEVEEDVMDDEMKSDSDDEMMPRKKKLKGAQEKLASAALCVGIGSFSDPPDIPGLAHFLEHMVFMGSSKYEDENSFDAFIKRHGGNTNASTDCERTEFEFEINSSFLCEGLDRFAQFFISPLMKESSTDRELEAVDSEFQMSLPADHFRKQQLFGSFTKEGHPLGKFMWGNSTTLKADPISKGIEVHKRLQEFRERMYSSDYMTLAVQSPESLDTLEEWVRESFSDIPSNGLPKPSYSIYPDPFVPEKFHKLYKIIPVKDVNQLEITWTFPCLFKDYKCKPLQYLSWLIGHEGRGSILARLKKRSLALKLFSGNDGTGFEYNQTCSIFTINVELSTTGLTNIDEVISTIFQYIKMLQKAGPQKRIFDEIKTIDDNAFRFQEEMDAVDNVELIADNMQEYPMEHYLTGHQLTFEYDPKVITECLSSLTAEAANYLMWSKSFQSCDQVEPWYQTAYGIEQVPSKWIQDYHDSEIHPDVHLPAPNIFIADDFNLKVATNQHPIKILDSDKGCVWYKSDRKFKIPKGFIYVYLKSELVNQSAMHLCLFDFFVTLLEHNMNEVAYNAEAAELNYSFRTEETGLVIRMSGFNHKLYLLFDTILDHIANFSVEDLMDAVMEAMLQSYHNHIIKPSKTNHDIRLQILQKVKWIPLDKRKACPQVTKDMVQQFAADFRKKMFVEVLVQGNYTQQEAIEFHNKICSKLNFDAIERQPTTTVTKIPLGCTVCKIKSFNTEDTNTVVTNYYQQGCGTIYKITLIELLVMLMEEPCFDFLRTQEQLGYSVLPTCRSSFGIIGFSVTVTTQATKFSALHVDQRIEAFLKHFREKLQAMTDKEFQTQVDALVTLKQCVDLNLAEEVNRNWGAIQRGTYVFDVLEREVKVLKTVKKKEILDLLDELVYEGKSRRKLSTQVVGFGDQEDKLTSSSGDARKQLNGVTNNHVDDMQISYLSCDGNSIMNIHKFKECLEVYPVTVINQ